ncbi:TPA: MobV family relaxase [Enterococcus hirae]
MSKIVARMAKMKTGNLGGIQRHNQRETDNHSNKDIDVTRSHLNYDLVNPATINYQKRVREIIDSQRTSTRAVRKDAVLVNEWIITSDKEFFETADSKAFFEDSLAYFSKRCGAQNIVYATVHLDESTPHMHLGIVPMIEQKLSSKQMFTREALKEIQDELPAYLKAHGHAIERGLKGSEQKHLTVEEYKVNQQKVQYMTEQVTELETHAEQITQELQYEQEHLDETAQILWSQDWDTTKQAFPSFSMTTEVIEPGTKKTQTVEVDAFTPKKYQFDFRAIFKLFREKYEQLKRYITELRQALAQKALDLDNQAENIEEREGQLEVLEHQIEIKHLQNEQLDTLLTKKTNYIAELERASELSMEMPAYVKPSRLNKNMLIVPKDKWKAKHIAAYSIDSALKFQEKFTDLEKQINRQAQNSSQTYALKREIKELEREKTEFKSTSIRLRNGLVTLYNEGKISMEDLCEPLTEQEKRAIGIEVKEPNYEWDYFERTTVQNEYEGPSMGL